jgi:hypothetical protein
VLPADSGESGEREGMIGAQIGRSRAGLRRTNRSKDALSAGQGATCADRGAVPGFGVEAGGASAGIGEVIYNSAVMLNLTEVLGLRGAM